MLLETIILITIIILLYLLAIMPKLHRHPDLKKLEGWLYAHRGLHDNHSEAPENSLTAFSHAVENHYGIELDVQLTKDFVPVILHDYHLLRACNVDRRVSEITYEELKQYTLFDSKEPIPTLQEALEVIHGQVPLIVELKIPFRAGKTCEKVSNILDQYQGVYCIESFNPFGLIWYKKYRPDVIRGQLSTDFRREKQEGSKIQYFILKHLLMNTFSKPDFIAYQYKYRKDLSFTLCRKLYHMKTFAWTIQSQEQLEENKGYFDHFIFDSFLPQEKSQ